MACYSSHFCSFSYTGGLTSLQSIKLSVVDVIVSQIGSSVPVEKESSISLGGTISITAYIKNTYEVFTHPNHLYLPKPIV